MNTPPLYIREATTSDMNSIISLFKTAYSNAGYIEQEDRNDTLEVFKKNQTTLIACIEDQHNVEHIVGTISVTTHRDVSISELANDFPESLDNLARDNDRCAEIGRLAIVKEFRHSLNIVFLLMSGIIRIIQSSHSNKLLCVVHPKHFAFYHKCLGLDKIDECGNLSGLINAPAFLLLGKFQEVKRHLISHCSKINVHIA